MTKVFLKKRVGRRVEDGHPWVFGNEVDRVEGDSAGGGIVELLTHDKKFIGRGYINLQSQIAVRLLTRDRKEQIDEGFFFNRLEEAWRYRERLGYTDNCRLVFGEADYLPGLIIDKFSDVFVLQTLSFSIDGVRLVPQTLSFSIDGVGLVLQTLTFSIHGVGFSDQIEKLVE